MADAKPLAVVKNQLSDRLLSEAGVSGVGVRGKRLVVYLENDDKSVRQKIARIVDQVAPTTPLVFEATGTFKKQ